MRKIRFIIPGKPKGKERPRLTKYGGIYTPKQTQKYQELVGIMYRSAGGREIDAKVPVRVHITAIYQIPSSTNKAMRELMHEAKLLPVGKPDIDNVVKIVLDGLNKVAWHDDAQVVSVLAEKEYGDEQCVIVTIEELPTAIEQYRGGARG